MGDTEHRSRIRVPAHHLSFTRRGALGAADDAFLPDVNGGLGAVGEMKLAEDVGDVTLDGLVAGRGLAAAVSG